MLVGYATVSQIDSTVDPQVRELVQAGCERVFTDVTASVQVTRRPGLNSALEYLRQNDTFVALQLIRLNLPIKQLLKLFVMLETRGVSFQSLYDPIDPATSKGQMLWRFLLALTLFER
jgi:DNA invertase Pin-like site-specific DNA recombinase